MRTRIRLKSLLFTICFIIGFTMNSVGVYAATEENNNADSSDKATEETSYVEIYVIDTIKSTYPAIKSSSSGKFYYNSEGLVNKIVSSTKQNKVKTKSVGIYNYNNNRLESTTYTFEDSSGQKTQQDEITKYTYDSKNRVTKSVVKQGSYKVTNKYKYDKNSNISKHTQITQANKFITKMKYNSKGQLIKADYGNGVAKYTYNKKGDVIKQVNTNKVNGNTEKFSYKYKRTYNSNGKLKKVTCKYTAANNHVVNYASDKYTYKKIKIKSEMKDIIEKQQKGFIN